MSRKTPCDAGTPQRLETGKRTCLTPAAGVTASLHDDGVVFLDVTEGRLFSANRVGADVWRAAARGLDLEAVAQEIAGGYGIAYATALADSERFLRELERHGLVTEGTAR
jgi:hypothetical protein